jgi:hypothetical protein
MNKKITNKINYTDYNDLDEDGDPIEKEIEGIELELNKIYVQNQSEWNETHFLIIFIDDKIALGKSILSKVVLSIGDYAIFNKNNGTKYNSQLGYRLTREVK